MDGAGPTSIREYRLSQQPRVSLETLARKLGKSKASLSRMERGLQPIPVDLLSDLSAETGIPADVLCPDLAKVFKREGEQ